MNTGCACVLRARALAKESQEKNIALLLWLFFLSLFNSIFVFVCADKERAARRASDLLHYDLSPSRPRKLGAGEDDGCSATRTALTNNVAARDAFLRGLVALWLQCLLILTTGGPSSLLCIHTVVYPVTICLPTRKQPPPSLPLPYEKITKRIVS